MPERILYQELGNGITCIDTMLHRPGLAACYLIEQDGMAGFIDTGTNNAVPILLEVLRRRALSPDDVAYVMPTHVHLDHAGGAGGLMREFPRATLLAHPRGARHLIDPARLEQGSLAVYGEAAFARLFGRVVPVDENRVREVEDGFELDFNGRRLLFLDTPGHARHHYCVFDEASRGIFTGDSFGISYPELNQGRARFLCPTTTPVQFDPDAWLGTLERLLSFEPRCVYLTHYGRHHDPAPLARMLARGIRDYAELAQEYSAEPDRFERIRDALLKSSINYLLDQQCGLDSEEITRLLENDMALNAQGLDHWLTTL